MMIAQGNLQRALAKIRVFNQDIYVAVLTPSEIIALKNKGCIFERPEMYDWAVKATQAGQAWTTHVYFKLGRELHGTVFPNWRDDYRG